MNRGCRTESKTKTANEMSPGPDPAGATRLFTRLATAGFSQDGLPLDVGLVIGVDRGVDVECVLQVLPGAGVDHGPLMPSETLLFRQDGGDIRR